jgi:hypothetical protein
MKLVPEIKKRWLEALRSGKYKQGKKLLRSYNNEFCCLGVLQDLVEPDEWILRIEEFSRHVPRYCYQTTDAYWSQLSREVLEHVNLSKTDMITLSVLNDNGISFEEIAQWIEENL